MTHSHSFGELTVITAEMSERHREFLDEWRERIGVQFSHGTQIAWQNPDTPTLAAVKEYATELANSADRGWIAPIGDELLHILENGERP